MLLLPNRAQGRTLALTTVNLALNNLEIRSANLNLALSANERVSEETLLSLRKLYHSH